MDAELIAIAEALSYIESTDHINTVILTDSKSSLQHLARCTSTFRGTSIAYTVLDNVLRLRSLGKNVILQWIPSHVGLEGNEIADLLAKQAISDGIPIISSPFYTNFIPKIKQICYTFWAEYFDKRSLEKGIWYKTIQPHPLTSPWINNQILNRKKTIVALRLRAGHIPGNKFLCLMGKSTTASCVYCNSNSVDDVYHILMECVQNEALRKEISCRSQEIGYCNAILASPLSDEAKILYEEAMAGYHVARQECNLT